jgi:uncharacterized Ntn-hydrolase superfamily protein
VTYSIVAHDPRSGAYGVAVQSHWFNVGRSTAWVRFRAGVVATQALTDPSYGPRGLDIMAAGVDGPTALRVLLDADPKRDRRQVAILDHTGRVGVHTGLRCVPEANHHIGDGWSVQGNLLTNPEVVSAMAETFPSATGTLAERMVTTLEAAERAGGDLRGSQSAAIRVVPGDTEAAYGHEAGIDILVADNPDPIAEIKRLVEVDRSYRALRRGGTALESGDTTEARLQYTIAARLRHGPEVDFWMAIGYFRMGEVDLARHMLFDVLERQPSFRNVLERSAIADPDLIPLLEPLST